MENEVRMKKSKLKKILSFSGVVILIIATFIFFFTLRRIAIIPLLKL